MSEAAYSHPAQAVERPGSARVTGSVKEPAHLRAADNTEELLREMAALAPGHPSRAALRARAIEAWLPLARRLAARYSGRGEPMDDLVQTAAVGLIKAVDRFDPVRGTPFLGYVIPTVLGEIKRHFRDRAWAVRVPRRFQELRLEISASSSELTQRLQRSPTTADIAAHLQIAEESVLESLDAGRAYTAKSLSVPIGRDDGQELGETLRGDEDDYELAEARVALGPAMAVLDERQRKIVVLRFYGNLTQTEIAERVGISQMHVSRLIRGALGRLRREL